MGLSQHISFKGTVFRRKPFNECHPHLFWRGNFLVVRLPGFAGVCVDDVDADDVDADVDADVDVDVDSVVCVDAKTK